MKLFSYEDFRAEAKARLPRFLFDYIDGGALSQGTKRGNPAALDAIALNQRVLRDVGAIDTGIRWFDEHFAMPLVLGPVGIAGMNARRGEVQAARAAQDAGLPFCLSTVSICSIEEVSAASETPFWFQLYVMRDRSLLRELIARARMAACTALIVTVDMPLPAKRYGDFRSGLAGADNLAGALNRYFQAAKRPRWALDVGLLGQPHTLGNVSRLLGKGSGLEDFLGWMNGNFDPAVTWQDLEAVRREWSGTLIVKGILNRDDALRAAEVGADAIVVSNHGGRQLDGAPASADALVPIADALAGRITVFADGGVRSGLDVVRMLALGADGVWLGRAWAYALAAGGRAGVARMLAHFADEIRITMALCGVTAVEQIDRSLIRTTSRDRR